MSDSGGERSALDGPLPRLVAFVLFLGCVGGGYLYYTGTVEPELTQSDTAPANPELQACLEQRLGDVTQMQADGVIDDAQAANFAARARDLCLGQFPPEGGPVN